MDFSLPDPPIVTTVQWLVEIEITSTLSVVIHSQLTIITEMQLGFLQTNSLSLGGENVIVSLKLL